MYSFKQLLFLVVFYLINGFSYAQINTVNQLEDAVTKKNDALEYEISIKLISDFISNPDRTSYEKYLAYTFKSYTYKRVFITSKR